MEKVKTDMAMDISFGSSGYGLVLARAFKNVSLIVLQDIEKTFYSSFAGGFR